MLKQKLWDCFNRTWNTLNKHITYYNTTEAMGFCERFVSVKGAGEEGFRIRSDDETTVTLSISCSYKHPHCQTAWLSLPAVLSPPDRKERIRSTFDALSFFFCQELTLHFLVPGRLRGKRKREVPSFKSCWKILQRGILDDFVLVNSAELIRL